MRRRLDFADHSRELDQNRYVYAVVSRRARGLSVGVNLNPDKVCNFDCPYCQVDRNVPGGSPEIDVEQLALELDGVLGEAVTGRLWTRSPFDTVEAGLRRVADIAFSGDGEPTSPPAFAEAARRARQVRDERGLDVPLRLITNATLFDRARVREGLAHFDELWCKLDAGTAAYFARVDGTRFPFERLLANLAAVARERPIVIQSLFPTFDGEAPPPDEVDAWVERLLALQRDGGRIAEVQVYTVVRRPADPRVGALDAAALDAIAARAVAAGLPATVYR
jgi:pyruvate-formate lyase-activating enzyme